MKYVFKLIDVTIVAFRVEHLNYSSLESRPHSTPTIRPFALHAIELERKDARMLGAPHQNKHLCSTSITISVLFIGLGLMKSFEEI